MNIFILDLVPRIAAQAHCDKHVVKMILESAQILSTVHSLQGSHTTNMYKPTHINHPCTKWAGRRAANYRWLFGLYMELCREYTYRYGKTHKCERMKWDLFKLPRNLREDSDEQAYMVTGFALAMPDEYKDVTSAVRSYRTYYVNDKAYMAKWTRRAPPEWWSNGEYK